MSDLKTIEMNHEAAMEMFGSMRGQLIISQALHIAIDMLSQVEPEEMRELSNIEDMKFLMKNLFPIYAAVAEASEIGVKDFQENTPE